MAHRAAKRSKLNQRGEDDYLPGNIVEIEIHNFMTYDHLKCQPGSRLNLVIGPNGSGKSSLVCAIALGLAGEPQLLGRASSVGAFVKRGEESGYIKISLRRETDLEKIVITRKIDTSNRSEWAINGVAVPKRDVITIIQKFNIQVNNLTQFLPQDRVCEFAKLTPIQLLEETEKAVGNPDLPVQHQELIEKSGQIKKLEVSVRQNRDTLNQLKTLNAELEKDVERVRQRQKLLDFVDLMKKKLPWLKYDMKKMEYMEAKKQETEAKKKMDKAAKILNDLKRPIEEWKKEKAMHESTSKKICNQVTDNAKKRMEVFERESEMVVQVRGKYAEMDELRRHEESCQQRITKAKEDLLAAEKELADHPIYEAPTDEIERIGNQILELRINANEVKSQRKEKENILLQKKLILKQYIDRLKEMENNNNKLLQALRNSGSDKIFEAYKWVQEHRSELRKEVYGPVLLEVNVPDLLHASYLERHVPNYIWKMRELGIYNRLDQVFEAPDAVKDVLISQAALEKSYIGSRDTDRRADEVSRLGILDLWTPESHYRWSMSRYGGHISALVDSVPPSRLFSCSVDVGDLEKLKSTKVELEQVIGELEGNLKMLQVQQRQLEDEEANLHKQQCALKWKFAEKHMMSMELDGKIREMETDLKQHEKSALVATTNFGNCKKETEQCKEQLHDAKRHAESVAIITEDLGQEFLKMPGTIEELEAAIQDNISEANSILFLNQNILEEYENRQCKIDAIAAKLEVDDKELSRYLQEINTLKENWLPTLRNLVAKINDTFSRNFQEMAVAGEVSLDEHDMDFDMYGILIKVKFRQSGQLQVLSAHHQSGGERSVSTILYLVSLQDLTNCPFRVVDEINQGMDPINERKMFQQLVRAASQPNTPQCFLLTPKLLPDLEYSNACSILNIMNGPWIEKPAKGTRKLHQKSATPFTPQHEESS
ncbi:hypothetical protein C4D60_Mb04t00330 [Musa balbisiana]|uniref:Structural maintenance of chromosomes protein 5 n=1 Tax=Musa balbisiana TaxID=52838 RepID=A0A4S8K8L6_MUSBA|nr:hypothetical protein C4D60_Mb04t00330 [Musa balbisiana]